MLSASPVGRGVIAALRRVAPLLAVLLFVVVMTNSCATWLVERENLAAPRDESTGIRIGAEVLDLGLEESSTAVLLVHGFIGGSSNFGELPATLAAKGYRVRAMLLPGHGTDPREFAHTSSEDLVNAVVTEAQRLREAHEHVVIVGHSMGATLSILASEQIEVDALVLATPYFRISYQWYYVLPAEAWTKLTGWAILWVYKGEGFKRVYRDEARPEIYSYKWVPSRGTKTLMRLGKAAGNAELLAGIDCPVLMLVAPKDRAASAARAETAFEVLGSTDKTIVRLEKSDHHLFYDYDREQAVQAITEFIDRISSFSGATLN